MLHRCGEFVWLPWLLEDRRDPEPASLLKERRVVGLTGRDHNGGGRMAGSVTQLAEKFHPVHVRHLKIQHDRIERLASTSQDFQCLPTVRCLMEFVLP